ncbi:MAG: hypothetical protein RLZZ143_3742 [Cyanobacteriota bacterium]|jgi:hypothetical protein
MYNLIIYGEAGDWFGVSLKTIQPWQKQAKIFSILSPSEPSLNVDKCLPKARQF